MKWTCDLFERERQSRQRYITFRPRIAQPLGLAREVIRYHGQQVWLVKVERLAQLQFQRAPTGCCARKSQLKNRGRTALKICALGCRNHRKACVRGGRFNW